ncbi:hypothetical protein [uncultured Flavobacterium sp.]|uniref:hypothetical protein n=1 Tax=uncultured Flavobacterium sp. TaxID=165435 RepID=UPI0011FD9F16|nr:hypothetical protein [uncultured Flavobacterium sp.]THD32868.1 MAG: hypothetical protein DI588_06495 [Flavobacterium johnsoniae]
MIREKQIAFDGQTWSWTNPNNTKLRWSGLSKEIIIKNIDNALINAKENGKLFEAKVAKRISELVKNVADEITDFSNEVRDMISKLSNGDIDCATKKYIIEAKSELKNIDSIRKLYKQLQKYLPQNINSSEMYMNPLNKKVVVVFENMGTYTLDHPILKELQNKGVIFIKGIDNLSKLY